MLKTAPSQLQRQSLVGYLAPWLSKSWDFTKYPPVVTNFAFLNNFKIFRILSFVHLLFTHVHPEPILLHQHLHVVLVVVLLVSQAQAVIQKRVIESWKGKYLQAEDTIVMMIPAKPDPGDVVEEAKYQDDKSEDDQTQGEDCWHLKIHFMQDTTFYTWIFVQYCKDGLYQGLHTNTIPNTILDKNGWAIPIPNTNTIPNLLSQSKLATAQPQLI